MLRVRGGRDEPGTRAHRAKCRKSKVETGKSELSTANFQRPTINFLLPCVPLTKLRNTARTKRPPEGSPSPGESVSPAGDAPRPDQGASSRARLRSDKSEPCSDHSGRAGTSPGASPEKISRTAASDDARGTSAVVAEPSASAPPARDAYAEVAAPRPGRGAPPRAPGEADLSGAGFVDDVFAGIDPVGISRRLLASKDERIVEKHFERLLDIKYGKPAASPAGPDEAPQFIWDLPRPAR